MALFRRVKPPFSLKTLQKDSNCALIQDPSQVWGVQDFLPRRNLLLATDTLATQNVTVVATAYKLYMRGTGSITLSGTGSGTLNGTGANDRVSLSFTPTAGTLTLTVSGTVTYGMLCRADTIDQSYQKITDWTTEQYAWAAQKSVPWLRRNAFTYCSDLSNAAWVNTISGTGLASTITPNVGANPIDGANDACRVQLSLNGGTSTSDISMRRQAATLLGTNVVSVYAKSYDGVSSYAAQLVTPNGGGQAITITPTWQRFYVSVAQTASVNFGIRLRGGQTPANSNTADILVYGHQLEAGTVPSDLQHISTTWDATYTANAIAAGYPISIWQDSAGTSAVNGDNQSIGKCANIKSPGTYDATQATAANQPKWRLDGNGKGYFERDLVNDALPVTLPTVLSDSQLGPELVTNGGFDSGISGWSLVGSGTTWQAPGGARMVSAGEIQQIYQSGFNAAKTYYVVVSVTVTSGSFTVCDQAGVAISATLTSSGVYTLAVTGKTGFGIKRAGTGCDIYIDYISVREVTGTNVVYTAEGNVTLKDSGLILSGSYAPIVPAADYGRIIMAGESKYDAKILKYLDGKRGRGPYALGPELVTNGGFDSDTTGWVETATSVMSWESGKVKLVAGAAGNGCRQQCTFTIGKPYLITAWINPGTCSEIRASILNNALITILADSSTITGSAATVSFVWVATETNSHVYIRPGSAGTAYADNISVREVLL